MRELLLGCILATSITQAQVGIGTTSPQEQLHIVDGNVRVDNLTPNLTSGTNVSVDANGTLILSSSIKGIVKANGSAQSIIGAECSKISRGDYQITFNNTLPNANYIVVLTAFKLNGYTPTLSIYDNATTGFKVNIRDDAFAGGYFIGVLDVNLKFMFKVEEI